jgi:hypothetical protein
MIEITHSKTERAFRAMKNAVVELSQKLGKKNYMVLDKLPMLDNKLIQIALVFFAFYVIMQIMNGNVSQENLDTVVTVSPEGHGLPPEVEVRQALTSPTQVTVEQGLPTTVINVETPLSGSHALTSGSPALSHALITPELAASSNVASASATPVTTSAPSAAITGGPTPHALTSVEETLLAAAPKSVSDEANVVRANQLTFAPEPTDLDSMFSRRGYTDPADLIPKNPDATLYGGFQPDPKLNQNFLQNRFSLGIDASVGSKIYINDLRGSPAVPLSVVSPWQQPTVFPDLMRKGLGEVS